MAGVGAAAAATVAVLGADASPAGAAVGGDALLGKDNKGPTISRTLVERSGSLPSMALLREVLANQRIGPKKLTMVGT